MMDIPDVDPLSFARKIGTSVAGAAMKEARAQWSRRGAGSGPAPAIASVERELEEALDTLVGDAATLIGSAKALAKAALSGRPADLSETDAREWLRTPDARRLLKDATLALVSGSDTDPLREAACASYAATSSDAAWWGGVLFDQAVGFLALSLDRSLPVGDRLGIQVTNIRADRLQADIAGVGAQLSGMTDHLLGAVEAALSPGLATDIVESQVLSSIERERRGRALQDAGRMERVEALTSRLCDGDLMRLRSEIRCAAFRLYAQLLARADRSDEASDWLAAARAAGASDLETDQARIAIVRRDWSTAFQLLEGRGDRESESLLLEALDGRDGREAALRYQAAHVPASRMGGFMLPVVAHWMLGADRPADAEALLDAVDQEHLDDNPTLAFVRARLRLASMVSGDRRPGIFETSGGFPQPDAMRDDHEGDRLRAAALRDLREAEIAAAVLDDPDYRELIDTNRLFLSLSSGDDEVRSGAVAEVLAKVASPSTVLDHAWLALAFDVPFDDRDLRGELGRAEMLGTWNAGKLTTATQLAMRHPADLLAFIEAHRDRMRELLPVELGYGIEIEALARRGRISEARARLEEATDPLGEELAMRLRTIIDEQEGVNPVAVRLAAYERTGSDGDLTFLTRALLETRDERAGDFAMRLWRRQRRTSDAIAACNALFDAGLDAELDRFLDELGDLVGATPHLSEHRAWSLFRHGSLDEARRLVETLRHDDPDRASLRQLAVNVLVEAGESARLTALAAEDLERRDSRDAEQLMQAAGLAHAEGGAFVDELVRAAVAKSPDDARVLLAAFGLAIRRGLDWNAEESGWLRRAIELSDDSGPIQRADLRDIVRMRDEGAGGMEELNRMIMAGEIPLGFAARPLGTTLSELLLGRLPANAALPPLRRLCLPIVSGGREAVDLSGAGSIGLDPAALMILHICGLLRSALDGLPGPVIPAGTLPLLLHDLERLNRPQASRVDQAARIRALAVRGRIVPFDLEDADDEIIALHAHARALNARLIHSSPISEPGSLGETTRDPTPYLDILASPQALVAALEKRGEIDRSEADEALERLGGYGAPWPEEVEVDLRRPLVLHAVALAGLEFASLLERLLDADAELHVPQHALDFLIGEIEQGERVSDLERTMARLRSEVATALRSGRARPGPFRRPQRGDEQDIDLGRDAEMTPLLSLMQDGGHVDVIVSGERMINAHEHFNDTAGAVRPVATPLDVIDHLMLTGAISSERRARARRTLREAGVALIPVGRDELVEAACDGDWTHGPGRALRAIRDSIHLPLVRGVVKLPADRPWLAGTVVSIALAIRGSWAQAASVERAEAASDFLLEMIPAVEGWSADDPSADAAEWAAGVRIAAYSLMAMPADVPTDRLKAYGKWFDVSVVPLLDGRDRVAMGPMLERIRLYLLLERDELLEGVDVPAEAVRRLIARKLPQRLFDELIEHAEVRTALGYRGDTMSLAGHEVAFSDMIAFFAYAVDSADAGVGAEAGEDQATLLDVDGVAVASAAEIESSGVITALFGQERGAVADAGLFAANPTTRLATLERLLGHRTIAPTSAARWRAAVLDGAPDLDLYRALMTDLDASTQAFDARMREGDGLRYPDLVPTHDLHYRNMVDPEAGDGTVPGTLSALVAAHRAGGAVEEAAVALAPLAISPDLRLADLLEGVDDATVARVARRMVAAGDPFGMLAGIELAASRHSDHESLRIVTEGLETLLGGEATALASAVDLFCIMGTVAQSAFDGAGVIKDVPTGIRRLAALAQAGHACRVLQGAEVETDGLLDEALRWAGPKRGLADIVDRFDATAWPRLWLQPPVLGPYMLKRLGRAVAVVPEAIRPAAWSELLAAQTGRHRAKDWDAGETMPGPMDEFGSSMAPRALAGDDLAATLDVAAGKEALDLLFPFVWAFRPPEDTASFSDTVLGLFDRLDGDDRRELAALAITVAARWRLEDVATGVLERLRASDDRWGMSPVRHAELTLAALGALSQTRREAELVELFHPVVFGAMDASGAAALAAMISMIEDLRPDWTSRLERLRSACILQS